MSLNNADQTTEGRCVSVTLPNLFSDFMAGKESVNPLYREVKPQADAWIAKLVTPPCHPDSYPYPPVPQYVLRSDMLTSHLWAGETES